MIPHWKVDLGAHVTAIFFSGPNVSVTVPEGEANRRQCMMLMNDAILATPYQWHSADCLTISEKPAQAPKGDAYVTVTPGLAVGVVTADCAPILFAGVKEGKPIIGAAHAGARGALKGIIHSTVKAMRELGGNDIRAAIGPCIHQKSYEVGQEFYNEFIASDPDTKGYFLKMDGSWHFDVPGYCGHLLTKENVPYEEIAIDTYADERCFSYRRATHKGEPDYGRQLSAIMISS